MRDETILCTLNNVEWCDAVCRSHGLAPRLKHDMWIQGQKGPPYYSNGITVSRSALEQQYAAIENLKSALPDGFSVKDSFACLDLGAAGFRTLFDAEWIWLDAASRGALHANGVGWFRVESERELVRWEAAWAAGGSPTSERVFMPALLQEARIAFFGVERDGEIVAGCAANRSRGDVVGFSNFFAPEEERDRFRAEAVAKVAEFAPGWPVVGYERGEDLAGLLSLGFRSVGALRVWLWP
jgi:hypothetical protein